MRRVYTIAMLFIVGKMSRLCVGRVCSDGYIVCSRKMTRGGGHIIRVELGGKRC